MKSKILLTFALSVAFASNVSAQTENTVTDSVQNTVLVRNDSVPSSSRVQYTVSELLSKGKLDLTKIYLNQVQVLNNALPYSAFPIKGQASSVNKLDIPVSDYTNGKREQVAKKGEKYNETVNDSLYEIIPYSDKVDIIKAIMFIQDIVNKLDKGL